MNVLVLGATGETGQRVVRDLAGAGHSIRALCRDVDRARSTLGARDGLELLRGDVREPRSLQGLGRGVDAAILCVGTRTYIGRNGGAAVDARGSENVCNALARDAVPHVVLLSAFGLDRRSLWLDLFSLTFNQYFRWKALAEQHVRAAGLRYTIVRPVNFHDGGPRRRPLLNQTAPLSLLRTVSRDVVAETLVGCVGNPRALDKTFELVESGDAPELDAQLAAMDVDAARRLPLSTRLF